MAARSAREAEEVSPVAVRMESSCCSQSGKGSRVRRAEGAGVDSDWNGLEADGSRVEARSGGFGFGDSGTGHNSKIVIVDAARKSMAASVVRIFFCTMAEQLF